MTTDDPSALQARARTALSLVARRHVTGRGGGGHESAQEPFTMEDLADGALPPPDDLLDLIESQLDQVPPEAISDRASYETAKAILLREGRSALRKATGRSVQDTILLADLGALEALVEVDGSRPSLLIQGGRVDHLNPFAVAWAEEIGGSTETVAQVSAAVGRLEPLRGSSGNYFGTGFVVDAAKGLVLTNRHVLEAMYRGLREFVDMRSGRMIFVDGAFMDFGGEANAIEKKRYRVVEGMPVGDDGTGYERLDAALLRIRPLDARERQLDATAPTELPAAVELNFEPAAALGSRGSFALIGYPGSLPSRGDWDFDAGVDWDWVRHALLGGYHGVKRLAPGYVDQPLGGVAGDPRRWCFGHDATTLRGSSGSACFLWKDYSEHVFGLHFAGYVRHMNFAHSIARFQVQFQHACAAF